MYKYSIYLYIYIYLKLVAQNGWCHCCFVISNEKREIFLFRIILFFHSINQNNKENYKNLPLKPTAKLGVLCQIQVVVVVVVVIISTLHVVIVQTSLWCV